MVHNRALPWSNPGSWIWLGLPGLSSQARLRHRRCLRHFSEQGRDIKLRFFPPKQSWIWDSHPAGWIFPALHCWEPSLGSQTPFQHLEFHPLWLFPLRNEHPQADPGAAPCWTRCTGTNPGSVWEAWSEVMVWHRNWGLIRFLRGFYLFGWFGWFVVVIFGGVLFDWLFWVFCCCRFGVSWVFFCLVRVFWVFGGFFLVVFCFFVVAHLGFFF